jgi:hypothetical protein
MRRNNNFWGILLVIIGVLAIANRYFDLRIFSMSTFWPLFVLIPGLIFETSYFATRRNPGLLVPGGILTTIGLLFFFETFTWWHFSEYTWPVYPLAVAIGLFQLYLFTGRNRGLLVPVFILTTVSLIAFLSMFFHNVFGWLNSGYIAPIIFILIGLFIIVGGSKK